jgi:hypothetical protein
LSGVQWRIRPTVLSPRGRPELLAHGERGGTADSPRGRQLPRR